MCDFDVSEVLEREEVVEGGREESEALGGIAVANERVVWTDCPSRSVRSGRWGVITSPNLSDDFDNQWIKIEAIDVLSNGSVSLVWNTNQVKMANVKYIVYTSNTLAIPIVNWSRHSESGAVIVVNHSVEHLYKVTIDKAFLDPKVMFFVVMAIKE